MAVSCPLIAPCGGGLVNRLVDPEQRPELLLRASHLPGLQISERAAADLELIACGGFSPLPGFMGREDYQRVLTEMRLAGGQLFPVPITLPVEAEGLHLDQDVALRGPRNELLALLTVREIYPWSRREEALLVFGTNDTAHPLVAEMHRRGRFNLSGELRVLNRPCHYDFQQLRLTPEQVRGRLSGCGRADVVAFQTRNPLHRVHEEMIRRAIQAVGGTLLLHPVVGPTRPGDVDHSTRVRCYQALAAAWAEPDRMLLALLPLAMRMAGPREALWHALIRRNYGANHLIVGRDHASPGTDSQGKPFYGPYGYR